MDALYTFDLNIDKTNLPMFYDIMRIITIQVITQFLFVMNNKNVSFFNMAFLKTTIFICLSVVIYWLIIRRLFNTIVDNDNNEKDNDESFLPWL